MAIRRVFGLNPRSPITRLIGLATVIAFFWILSVNFSSPDSSFKVFSSGSKHPSCSPSDYSAGYWDFKPKTSAKNLTSQNDMLAFSGFQGCASSREFWWHLAADREEQYDRFPGAHSYEWIPGKKCNNLRRWDPAEVVRDLVQDGGWLLIGDSVTENHFFSLSCLLYPYVIATPTYTPGGSFDRAWPQNLYLKPDSPIIPYINFPKGFNITGTPLVTFRRIDILMSKDEITAVHKSMNPKLPDDFQLFSEEPVWTLPVKEYLDIFTTPLPKGNYGTMVISTGGHWTTSLFSGFNDENKKDKGYGIDGVIALFRECMTRWATQVQAGLWKEGRGLVKGDRSRTKKVVIRAYLPGHEDCHAHREPWKEVQPFVWNWYNWGSIWEFNSVFKRLLSAKDKFPDIHFLDVDRPARLRPDAHTTGDCLHIMTGAGVLEGWSHYIWHFVTKELKSNGEPVVEQIPVHGL